MGISRIRYWEGRNEIEGTLRRSWIPRGLDGQKLREPSERAGREAAAVETDVEIGRVGRPTGSRK